MAPLQARSELPAPLTALGCRFPAGPVLQNSP